jgi:hypothetical protein
MYQASLEKKLEETKITESGSLDMDKMWNNVKERIIAAGEEVMGTTQQKNVEWFDEECREKIAKKNKARRRMLPYGGNPKTCHSCSAFDDSFQKLYERCQPCVVKDGDYFEGQ